MPTPASICWPVFPLCNLLIMPSAWCRMSPLIVLCCSAVHPRLLWDESLPLCCCTHRFAAINGLLLPGGGANLSPGHPFYDAATSLVLMALDANDKGDYFPVSDDTPAQTQPHEYARSSCTKLGCCTAIHAAWPGFCMLCMLFLGPLPQKAWTLTSRETASQ